jgi:hypothetical protein
VDYEEIGPDRKAIGGTGKVADRPAFDAAIDTDPHEVQGLCCMICRFDEPEIAGSIHGQAIPKNEANAATAIVTGMLTSRLGFVRRKLLEPRMHESGL